MDLRDNNDKLIGQIQNDYAGRPVLRDASNMKVASYDPKTNETRDSSNRKVGSGNLLTMLLR